MEDQREQLISQLHSVNLPDDQKEALLARAKAIPNPLQSDPWIYRLVVLFLGFSLLATVGGGLFATMTTGAQMPEGLVALGSAAVGALAGLLAPSPVRGSQGV